MRLGAETGLRAATKRSFEAIGAVARMILFGAEHLFGRLTGQLEHDAVGMRRLWFAIGRWRGATGHTVTEYARN
jgi:hypothetical protein